MKKRTVQDGKIILTDPDGQILFAIQEHLEDRTMTIAAEGTISSETAADFEDELMAAITVCDEIVIDFTKVTFISSAGLKVLLSAQQLLDELKHTQLRLRNLSKAVSDVFEETGFDGLFIIEK